MNRLLYLCAMQDEKDRMIEFLEEQLRLAAERDRLHLEKIGQLSGRIEQLSDQIGQSSEQNVQLLEQLNRLLLKMEDKEKTIKTLEEALLQKSRDNSAMSGRIRGLTKLLKNTSEKITPDSVSDKNPETSENAETPESAISAKDTEKPKALTPKERGNNGARRKDYHNLEEEIVDVWPDDPLFDREKATALRIDESVRYYYYPCRIVKKTYRQHDFVKDSKVYTAAALPRTPFMNSNFEASFIAGLIQFRYIYSMPVERIVKFINESGFELNKQTAHGLISKTYTLLERFEEVLHKAILRDSYIRMDETYHQIINERINEKGKATCKGYVWAAYANTAKLVHFFYRDGSRGKEVFLDYLDKSYRGAVHTDGLACYKAIETDTYPDAIRISCAQHAKRKFIDAGEDGQAKEIIDTVNRLYRVEHKMLPEWDAQKRLEFRNREAPPILGELKEKLLRLRGDPDLLPSTPLATATHYMLNEFDAIKNYLLNADYTLDNNKIEQVNRYISLSRRNSLFFGSHAGAKRSALLFSLACSCRLHGINTFDYFTDILSRMPYISPNASFEVLRELLPDRWTRQDDG
jgi:TolA-binding protein